ncbi:MAG TPA: T9SS type A sorting domain-containing protein [Ignavibacteria bacterium]|nr:T9SS type A sorting domain-containing protein [Ignavibacteria bacterium]
MKKKYILFFAILFFGVSPLKAELYNVGVFSNFFLPSTLFNVNVGDTVRWTLMEGFHTTTSVTVPSGAATWDHMFLGSVGETFDYIVTEEGTYDYTCIFHGGMDASFEVILPVEISTFSASVFENKIKLLWTTVMEFNNLGFDIERKIASTNQWLKVGFVKGNGTSNKSYQYSFIDESVSPGRYNYRLKQLDYNGNYEYFNLTGEISIGVPDKYFLSQNYPNPFNPVTRIDYQLPYDGYVSLKIYDIAGREAATLINGNQTAGIYTLTFNAEVISSGIYFYRLVAENNGERFIETKRMTVLK